MVIPLTSDWLRTNWTVPQLQEGLEGSPYSIPDPSESRDRVQSMLDSIQTITSNAVEARAELFRNLTHFAKSLRHAHRVRELHESNRVEGLGPELIAHTAEILRSKDAAEIEAGLTRFTLLNTITSDSRTLDVLQLHGAKLLADNIMHGSDRPITEIDIRGMHRMIMGNHHSAGRYKMWCNEISGADHIPFAPSDTPSAMGELTEWLSGVQQECLLPPVVAAATVHAWLAHIHPFEDGNGRVARLLANIIVGGAGLPPVIIRVSGDRGRYINALAISDQGGDLAPLTGVFLRVLKRSIRDMRDPSWALKIFQDEIRKRASSAYTQWKRSFLAWLELLGGQLALHGLSLRTDPEEMIDVVGFARIKEREREGLVVGGIGEPQRYPNSRAYLLLDPADALFRHSHGEPALSFLIYSQRPWSSTVYQKMHGMVDEVIVREDHGEPVVIRTRTGRVLSLTAEDAADFVATSLARDFQDGIARARFQSDPALFAPRRTHNGL